MSFESADDIRAEIWSTLSTYCATRGEVSVIEAVPKGLTPTQGVSYRSGAGGYGFADVDTSHSYLFFGAPKIRTLGSYGAQARDPKPLVIARFAQNMARGYPWLATAGPEDGKIAGALGVEHNVLNTADADTFADEQINPIVWDKPRRAAYIRDVLTCQKEPTQLQQIGVREGVNWVKRRFRYHAQGILFQPNDPESWRLLYRLMREDLNYASENRGLDGFEGSGWQYVGDQESIRRQDATFNSQSDLLQGKYKVAIYMVWIGAIREIELTAVLTKSSIEFTEE